MLESIVAIIIAVSVNGTAVATFGPHQEPDKRVSVPVFSEKTGEILYHNYVVE